MKNGGEAWIIGAASVLNGFAALVTAEFFRRRTQRQQQPAMERDAVLASAERAVGVIRTVMDGALKERDRQLHELRQQISMLSHENSELRRSLDEARADLLELRAQLRDVRVTVNEEPYE